MQFLKVGSRGGGCRNIFRQSLFTQRPAAPPGAAARDSKTRDLLVAGGLVFGAGLGLVGICCIRDRCEI